MHNVDFLPLEYRQESFQRQSKPWRVVVVAVFLALVGAAMYGQYSRKHNAEKTLAAMQPDYDRVTTQNTKLSDLHARLKTNETQAQLFTYLRHPWPRTQLLSATLASLPDKLVLQNLQIGVEAPAPASSAAAPATPPPPVDKKAEAEALAKLPPAEQDLKQFREQYDKSPTVIHLSGFAGEPAALHQYLDTLGKKDLFTKVNLDSIETVETHDGHTMRFNATVLVRPGYGQPGGPAKGEGRGGGNSLPPNPVPTNPASPPVSSLPPATKGA